MSDVIRLDTDRVFTLEEAREILPVLRRVTEDTIRAVEAHQRQMLNAEEGSELAERTRQRIEESYRRWIGKVERLGGHPKGPWLVDLDNGEDLFCWRWPEDDLVWAHGYEDGFAGRYRIEAETPGA